jgi:hypothetical protein
LASASRFSLALGQSVSALASLKYERLDAAFLAMAHQQRVVTASAPGMPLFQQR